MKKLFFFLVAEKKIMGMVGLTKYKTSKLDDNGFTKYLKNY